MSYRPWEQELEAETVQDLQRKEAKIAIGPGKQK
jgi:hypothetical protein